MGKTLLVLRANPVAPKELPNSLEKRRRRWSDDVSSLSKNSVEEVKD